MPRARKASPSRREFLISAAAAAAAGCATNAAEPAGEEAPATNAPPASVPAPEPPRAAPAGQPRPAVETRRARGANERVSCAVIGVGKRGSTLLRAVLERPDVDVVAVADAYDVWRDRALQWIRQEHPRAKGYVRFEELLEKSKVDAVIVAAPDHIHAPAAMAALDAGKDVYCEKPIALTTQDAAAVRDRAIETGAVFQAGTQLRSEPMYQKAREIVQSGAIGKVVAVVANRHFAALEDVKAGIPPEANKDNVHWDAFVRDTKRYPLDLRRYFRWREFCEYSNGFTGDLMVHHLDACHFIMGCGMPSRVVSAGGIYLLKNGRTCADTVTTVVEYPEEFQFVFSATGANAHYGLVERYIGAEGVVEIRDMAQMSVFRNEVEEKVDSGGLQDAPHLGNFFDCVRSRAETVAPAEAAFAAATVAHMAVMSQQSGAAARWEDGRVVV